MKVALIADVHANLPALEAVLADARRKQVDAIWNAGDLIGYGPFPDEVVKRLKQEGVVNIVGNYDLKALHLRQKPYKGKAPEKGLAFNWAGEHLSPESRRYLLSLPSERQMTVEGKRILLVHGSPAASDEHLGPETPEERLRQLARMAEADIIICGHSHTPFIRKVGRVCFVNTGSVGRSDDGDMRASYAVMELTRNTFHVEHYRVRYDIVKAAAAARERGLPEHFAQMILRARSLDAILQAEQAEAPSVRLGAGAKATSSRGRVTQETKVPAQVIRLAEECQYDAPHTKKVTELALRLFDELAPLHRLRRQERFWLQCAGLLHDIGWIEGRKAHHKTALKLILESPMLPFTDRERLIVGSVARYHRRALPSEQHAHFAALDPDERRIVSLLAGMLRVADGLDVTHQAIVKDLTCDIRAKEVVIRLRASQRSEPERQKALSKGKLFQIAFDRKLIIEWH